MKLIRIISFFLILAFCKNNIKAQACCTAGTPLLGSLDLTSTPKRILNLGLTFHHNQLSDVLYTTKTLESNQRERISQSLLFESSIGISNSFSVSAIFSFIRQTRTIFNKNNNNLSVQGIGDIVIIGKYNLLQYSITKPSILAFGIGLKIPVGNSNIKHNGILIPADMQPGSGSWDILISTFYQKNNFLHNNIIFVGSASYKINGTNKRFGERNESYKFGNELLLSLGFTYSFSNLADISLITKFRNTQKDKFAQSGIPNTGGNWFYFSPNFLINLKQYISLKFAGDIPLYRNVLGTQLTTTFTTSLGIYYTLNF